MVVTFGDVIISQSRNERMSFMNKQKVKPVIGALAEKFSAGFAHPTPVAGDSEIRKILPHR